MTLTEADRTAGDSETTAVAVEVRAAYRTFEQETAPVRALRGADLQIAAGEFVAVMGPSGCGKSTLPSRKTRRCDGDDRRDQG